MSQQLEELKVKFENLSDSELVRIIEVDYSDYREEVLSMAKQEMQKRGLASNIREEITKELIFSRDKNKYAGFILRTIAYIIDSIILSVLFYIGQELIVSLSSIFGSQELSNDILATILVLFISGGLHIYAILLILAWPYYTIMESSSKQATIGKMVVGIVVTDTNGERISFGRANARYWSKILSSIILCIGYIMAAFTERKQTLHDIISDCIVVEKNIR